MGLPSATAIVDASEGKSLTEYTPEAYVDKLFSGIARKCVIAQIKPSTNTRIDFGLALKDTLASGKLIDTGDRAKGDRVTHRIAVSSKADIAAELKGWLRAAYDMDA